MCVGLILESQPGGIDKPLSIFLHQKRLLRHPVGLRDVGDHLWGVDFGHLRGAPDADVDRVVVGGVPDVDFAELTLVHMFCNKTYVTRCKMLQVYTHSQFLAITAITTVRRGKGEGKVKQKKGK